MVLVVVTCVHVAKSAHYWPISILVSYSYCSRPTCII